MKIKCTKKIVTNRFIPSLKVHPLILVLGEIWKLPADILIPYWIFGNTSLSCAMIKTELHNINSTFFGNIYEQDIVPWGALYLKKKKCHCGDNWWEQSMSAVISMASFNTWNTQNVNLVFRWGLHRISAQASTIRNLGGKGFKPFSTHCIDLMISIYNTWIWPLLDINLTDHSSVDHDNTSSIDKDYNS